MKIHSYLLLLSLLSSFRKSDFEECPSYCIVCEKEVALNDSLQIINCSEYDIEVFVEQEPIELFILTSDTGYYHFSKTGNHHLHYLRPKMRSTSSGFVIEIEVIN